MRTTTRLERRSSSPAAASDTALLSGGLPPMRRTARLISARSLSDLVAYRHRDDPDAAAFADVGHEVADQAKGKGQIGTDHQQEEFEGNQQAR
jgi:hypothetical protein